MLNMGTMNNPLKSYAAAAVMALPLMLASPSAMACNGNGNCDDAPGQVRRGAPGPVAGAGLLPALAIGYGVYWLVKRRRRQSEE
jgi:hypothetical protein